MNHKSIVHLVKTNTKQNTTIPTDRSKAGAIDSFKEIGFVESTDTDDGEEALKQSHFKLDKLCPLFLSCIPLDRSEFAKSHLMQDNQFIMQVQCISTVPYSQWTFL